MYGNLINEHHNPHYHHPHMYHDSWNPPPPPHMFTPPHHHNYWRPRAPWNMENLHINGGSGGGGGPNAATNGTGGFRERAGTGMIPWIPNPLHHLPHHLPHHPPSNDMISMMRLREMERNWFEEMQQGDAENM